jgi:NAD(P)-dependent dehydrogenase (short-subunit alcohol dehydrogenase family)
MKRLSNRRILITGAASGIGAAIAALFAAEGAALALFDRDRDGVQAKAKPLSAFAAGVDVTNFDAVADAAAKAAKAIGGIDGIVNAAGIMHYAPFEETNLAAWQKTLEVNLTGPWVVCRATLPYLRQASFATIVNIASGLGLRPASRYSAYAASKAGLIALSKTLAMELAPAIRVNALCPGAAETPMTAPLLQDATQRAAAAANYALGRLAKPSEIADAALFLTGSEAEFITGVTLPVDGGRTFQ